MCVPVTIGGAVGHNKPLKHRRPKWKSDVRLTEAQLQQKRDEFWDTAPAFDGRAEIWDALRASVQALDSGDHQLAQAILDGAGISLPNGNCSARYNNYSRDQNNSRYVDAVAQDIGIVAQIALARMLI